MRLSSVPLLVNDLRIEQVEQVTWDVCGRRGSLTREGEGIPQQAPASY